MARRISKATAAKRLSAAVTAFTRAFDALPDQSDPQWQTEIDRVVTLSFAIDRANDVYLEAV